MASKKAITLVLKDYRSDRTPEYAMAEFMVKSITNSVAYAVSQFLEESEVKIICERPGWTVKII